MRCAGDCGYRPCSATLLTLRLGPGVDPEVSEPVAQIRDWIQVWLAMDAGARSEVLQAWRIVCDELSDLRPNERWREVRGQMAATIATLLQFEWQPLMPRVWKDTRGNEVATLRGHSSDGAPTVSTAEVGLGSQCSFDLT